MQRLTECLCRRTAPVPVSFVTTVEVEVHQETVEVALDIGRTDVLGRASGDAEALVEGVRWMHSMKPLMGCSMCSSWRHGSPGALTVTWHKCNSVDSHWSRRTCLLERPKAYSRAFSSSRIRCLHRVARSSRSQTPRTPGAATDRNNGSTCDRNCH
jgi:hypothetical protein